MTCLTFLRPLNLRRINPLPPLPQKKEHWHMWKCWDGLLSARSQILPDGSRKPESCGSILWACVWSAAEHC